jgi:hypothetical protein
MTGRPHEREAVVDFTAQHVEQLRTGACSE